MASVLGGPPGFSLVSLLDNAALVNVRVKYVSDDTALISDSRYYFARNINMMRNGSQFNITILPYYHITILPSAMRSLAHMFLI